MKKLFQHHHIYIYQHHAGITGSQYLIAETDKLTLIDTGLSGSHTSIMHGIERLGFQALDLKTILITHADPDHYGAASEIKNLTNAKIFASRQEAQSMRNGELSRKLKPQGMEVIYTALLPLYKIPPVEVDEIVQPGDELDILDGLKVIDSTGHTPGHISFYAPKYSILFSGDSIKIRGKKLSVYEGGTTWDIKSAKRSFTRQTRYTITLICAGHRTRFL
ncbi:MAG: MBL fold metallo-hydrolase [Methanosarcinaceae archaeon]|nr:MBL fold metallo-hydrolase [Methanosarcinaceae archaeon]